MIASDTRMSEGTIRFPVVGIEAVLAALRSPNTTKVLVGVRRQVVEKAKQLLEGAKRNQIDDQIELDRKDVGAVLDALALTVEWMGDLIFFKLNDDEQY